MPQCCKSLVWHCFSLLERWKLRTWPDDYWLERRHLEILVQQYFGWIAGICAVIGKIFSDWGMEQVLVHVSPFLLPGISRGVERSVQLKKHGLMLLPAEVICSAFLTKLGCALLIFSQSDKGSAFSLWEDKVVSDCRLRNTWPVTIESDLLK